MAKGKIPAGLKAYLAKKHVTPSVKGVTGKAATDNPDMMMPGKMPMAAKGGLPPGLKAYMAAKKKGKKKA